MVRCYQNKANNKGNKVEPIIKIPYNKTDGFIVIDLSIDSLINLTEFNVLFDAEFSSISHLMKLDEILKLLIRNMTIDIISKLNIKTQDMATSFRVLEKVNNWCEEVISRFHFEEIFVIDHVEGCENKALAHCESTRCMKFCKHCSESCDCYTILGTGSRYLRPTRRCNFKKLGLIGEDKSKLLNNNNL